MICRSWRYVSSPVAVAPGFLLPLCKRTSGSCSEIQVTVPGILLQLPIHVMFLPEVLKVMVQTGTIQMVKSSPWEPKGSVKPKVTPKAGVSCYAASPGGWHWAGACPSEPVGSQMWNVPAPRRAVGLRGWIGPSSPVGGPQSGCVGRGQAPCTAASP